MMLCDYHIERKNDRPNNIFQFIPRIKLWSIAKISSEYSATTSRHFWIFDRLGNAEESRLHCCSFVHIRQEVYFTGSEFHLTVSTWTKRWLWNLSYDYEHVIFSSSSWFLRSESYEFYWKYSITSFRMQSPWIICKKIIWEIHQKFSKILLFQNRRPNSCIRSIIW